MGKRFTYAHKKEMRDFICRKTHGTNEQAGMPPKRHAARREIQRLQELRQAGVVDDVLTIKIKARGGQAESLADVSRHLNGEGE